MPARVIFTMDNLGDAADLYRGNITEPRKPGENYAFDVGYPSLIDLFARHEIPITYFIEGWSAKQYPREIERILSKGNNIGMHGWTHEVWHELEEDEARELATRATESIQARVGKSPLAFRAPGGPSTPFTRQLLRDLNYNIDASLTETGAVSCSKDGFTCIPYQWIGVDATHWLWNEKSSDEVETTWQSALLNAAHNNQHLVFIWHPHVMGMKRERLAVGEKIIQFVQNDSRFNICTLEALRDLSLQEGNFDD